MAHRPPNIHVRNATTRMASFIRKDAWFVKVADIQNVDKQESEVQLVIVERLAVAKMFNLLGNTDQCMQIVFGHPFNG